MSDQIRKAGQGDTDRWAEELRASMPFFVTTEHVRRLLHFDNLAQARYWLRIHEVPFIHAGKGKVFRRQDIIEVLEASLERPAAQRCAAEAAGRKFP